ncbi:XdhC family protein [bacterium]|nr:XdhC family protein [bacterium]
MNIYNEIIRHQEENRAAALATVVKVEGSAPQVVGAKMLIDMDGNIYGTVGGGTVEARVIEDGIKAITERTAGIFKYNFSIKNGAEGEMICGGQMEIFIEPLVIYPMLYIFGGGHIGSSLAKIAIEVGFQAVVIDDRKELLSSDQWPESVKLLQGNFTEIAQKLNYGPDCFIVIATHGHLYDQDVLEECISKSYKYIGMIGSKNKVRTIFNNLIDKGINQKLLNRVHTPIGLDIGGRSPAEIAVSIIAEIIAVKYDKADNLKLMKLT